MTKPKIFFSKVLNLAVLLALVPSSRIFAAEIDPGANKSPADCTSLLKGDARAEFRVIPSPRAANEAETYSKYVTELVAPGGILDQLGIEMTGQVVEFLQPRDLNAVTSGTAGGYPVSHYLDGAAVISSLKPKGGGFALEVVYPGPEYQHGFYRDDNPVFEQFSIIDHVVGHNHFAYTSGLSHYRYGQGLVATRKLDEILRAAYQSSNKAEVQRYYLWALSLAHMWDWYAPLFESSKDFEPQLGSVQMDLLGRSQLGPVRHPRRVTENILSAFAGNIHSSEPSWKREILEQLITSQSFRPALVHTQIMNEGWASIMQEIIPKHTKDHHNFNYWFGASRVMQAEARPNLGDPYSLGVACWRRIRERFLAEPAQRALKTEVEKDRAFIAYASEIISSMTDEEFLRFAMDQIFVDRFDLAVVKKLPEDEWKEMPQSQDPEKDWQWKIASKNADRVAQMVIDKVLKPKYFYNPRVKLVRFNRPGSGEVELVLDDEVGAQFPLNPNELGPTLYALANIIGKPISLLCTLKSNVVVDDSWNWQHMVQGPIGGGQFNLPLEGASPTPQDPLERVRVVVAPNGDLKVFKITDKRAKEEIAYLPDEKRALSEEYDEAYTAELLGYLSGYIQDLYLENDYELEKIFQGSNSLRSLQRDAPAMMIDGSDYDGLVAQAPNSAGAMLEYKSMLDLRLFKAMERATRKKGGFAAGPGGVRVKALPSVVGISYDRQYIQSFKDEMSSAGGSKLFATWADPNVDVIATGDRNNPINPDEGGSGSVGGISGEEGDHFWGPGDPSGSARGSQPGEDPDDLSWVDLPEGLYDKFLGERVKLPVLNRKPGDSKSRSTRAGGRVRRKQGVILAEEVLNNAVKRGVGGVAGDGEDPFEDLADTLEQGFERLQPRDIVVKSRVPDKKPDIKAVVTFVLDASGSTMPYYEAFKRFVYDVESLVRANYKGFAFRYIIFDTQAHVMKNKKDFFRAQLGGGTIYSTGIRKAQDLFGKEYPRSTWDRYTFLLGDMEDFSPDQAYSEIMKLLESSEYFGVVAGLHGGGRYPNPFNDRLRAESANNPQLGYTKIDDDGGYQIKNIKEVLKNDEK